jgi:membrane-associated phospholipid phosphatase
MYVGAHLPLDLVGGAGLGVMISAVVRRLLPE